MWQMLCARATDLRVEAIAAAVPIGFALVILRSIQAIRRDLADLRDGRGAYTGKAMFDE